MPKLNWLIKRCINNSLLSRDKTMSSLLELTGHVFWFHNMFWKNVNCFQFWWKTYTKGCTSNYVISRVKRLHVSKDFLPLHFAVQVLSISGFDSENRKMWCKQKYFIKSIAMKIPNLILFPFCLLCWLKNHSFCVLSLLYLQIVLII